MTTLRQTIDFLLHDWLAVEGLAERERFSEHSRETFDAVLDTCERIAREKYAPFNRTVDAEEPRFDGEKVILPQATYEARQAYAESGMLSRRAGLRARRHAAALRGALQRPTPFSPRPRPASAQAC